MKHASNTTTTHTMKTQTCILGLVLAASLPVQGALYEFGTLNGDAAIGIIPDNSTIGLYDAQTISGLDASISALTLTFELQGGYAGDLSGYLRLGNLMDSPSYSLTSLIASQALSPSAPTTYSVNFSTTAFADAFGGANPNNTWTLFFADTAEGDQTAFNGWSLDITAVPEPATWAGLIFGGGVALFYGLRSGPARNRIRRWRVAVNEWLDAA